MSENSDQSHKKCALVDPGKCSSVRGGGIYCWKTNIAFVGQLSFNHLRQIGLFWKKKMVNEGLRSFFLVNGRRLRQLQQYFACLKKAIFCIFFHLLIWGKKLDFVFGYFLLNEENKMKKFQTTFACLKRQQNRSQSLILFSQKEQHTPISFHFCIENTKAEKCMKAGKRLCNVGKPTGSKTLSFGLTFFFPLYSFFRRRSSHFKWVVQHVKMKPAKRLS